MTRLADCLALGVCVTVAAVGVVTAAPGLAAAAQVVRGWEGGDQPPLIATFVRSVRAETVRLLGPQLALLGVLAVAYLNAVAAANGLPGGALLRVVALAGGALAALSFLAMFPVRAAAGGSWWGAWRAAAEAFARRPWLPVALTAVLVVGAVLVIAVPPTSVLVGGPVMLAVGVLCTRGVSP